MIDTVVHGDGGPGPYSIGSAIPDTASLTVTFPDSVPAPSWIFLQRRNEIVFSNPIDSGIPVRVRFITLFYGVPKVFSLYSKSYLALNDTSWRSDSALFSPLAGTKEKNLNVSGYKSVGVSVGSFGQVNLEQGLDVRIGGTIRPKTSVEAHLADQGSSLDGATREISDFDMIYLALDDPSYHAIVGDQYVVWPFTGLLSGRKKIKGLSVKLAPAATPLSVGGFGALAGGSIAVETKQGRTGVQGPYYLTGKGERDFIQPISGTVSVRLNGRELSEGKDRDFIVDYELGTITFTPKILIKNEDLIRIEYEYKLFSFRRTLLGAAAGVSGPDSLFSAQGALWSESDGKNHPIDLILTNDQIDSLKKSGDRLPLSSTARLVHPNDVAGESQLYHLYRKRFDPAASDSFFVRDSLHAGAPDSAFGFYYVWFRPVNKGEKGRYDKLVLDHRGWAYVYTGNDSGAYTDRSPIPSPERRTSGEIVASVCLPSLRATVNVAGQDNDRNLYSAYDDRDNKASAASVSFLAGAKDLERRSAWLAGSHRFTSERFDAEALSANDRKESWDDVRLIERKAERRLWDATAGVTIAPGLQTELTYGQNRTAAQLVTDKLSPAARYTWADRFSLDYTGAFFRHHLSPDKGFGRREYATATVSFPRQSFGLRYRDEWRTDSLYRGAGLYEGGILYDLTPFNLHEQVSYVSRRKAAPGEWRSSDTGHSIRWEQSFDRALLPAWRVSGASSFDRSTDDGAGRTSTMLIDFASDVSPKTNGFASRQHYRTSAENASSFIQIPVYAGKGMGTHVYDSARKEYVPKIPGDFFMQQQEVYDQASDLRVRKTSAGITWSYRPMAALRGILNDLAWQGMLLCEEHIDAGRNEIRSWAPGYLSLSSPGSGAADAPVRFADLSYRQEIDWRPKDSGIAANGKLSVTPAYRKIRNYRETSLEGRLEADRDIGRLTFGGAINILTLVHRDTSWNGYEYRLNDQRAEVSQRCRLFGGFSLSLLEVAGLAQKSDLADTYGRPPTLDSSFYYQIVPGLTWQPAAKGSLIARYTYSVVPLPGDLDYRMARGFLSGASHQATLSADIKAGERLLIIGTYRGDWHKPLTEPGFGPANHVLSLEVRVFM